MARARAICSLCPVREVCLEFALVLGDGWGIWGGYTGAERDRALVVLGSVETVMRRFQEGTLAEVAIVR